MKKLLLLLPAALAACAQNPATGGQMFSLVTPSEEREIGEHAATEALNEDGLYRPESATTKYVNALCDKIYASTEAAANPVRCNFIDNGDFNAYATPGYMFVNRGLLPFVGSEAELAAVLGHESGHLTARHILQSATHAKIATVLLAAGTVAVATQTDDQATINLATAAGGTAATVGLMTYSRAHENEADALGRRYMERAGYDPREAVNMVKGMQMYDTYATQQAESFGSKAPTTLLDKLKSSHPGSQERVDKAIAAVGVPDGSLHLPAGITPATTASDPQGRKRYMEAIEGLTVGPARRYGIARKAELVLTKQRLVIPLPAETTTAYIGSGKHDVLGTWLIAHPQSGAYVEVNSLKMKAGRNPGTLVQELLPALHGPVERIAIGSGETQETGYTATYKFLMNEKRYRLLAVPPPPEVDEMVVLTIVFPNEETQTREEGNLMAILKNMKPLTKDTALKYKQLELHTFTAGGETVKMRAEKLPTGAMQEDLFRAMNNLPTPMEMTPGKLYKTIIDPNPPSL